jgi:hypothetical protein
MVLIGCSPVVVTADPGTGKHVESYTGEVLIDSKDARVIVLVDTFKGSGRDGVVDRWFVLQAEEALPALAEHLETAQIVHSPGHLRIVSAANRVLFDLVVPGHQQPTEVPENFKATTVAGIGLSHNTGETTIRIPKIRRDGLTAFDCEGCGPVDPDYGWGASSCASGGSGSVSCSASTGTYSCSVSCMNGYYACCNAMIGGVSCKCVKN